MDRALIILSALVLNALLGGPRHVYVSLGAARLMRWPAQSLRALERRLNRDHRSDAERETRGMVVVAAAFLGSLLVGWFGNGLFDHGLRLIELLVVTVLLPVRPAWDIASGIKKCLQAGDTVNAKQVLEGTAWRHYAVLDEYGVARSAIELLAVYFSEQILAPALWYLLFGLPGVLLSKTAWLLHETLAPDPAFGQAARVAHTILHYLPSRLAALLWMAASLFLPSARPRQAAQQIIPALPAAAPAALSLLSAASVLKLSLGGPVSVYVKEWQGSGSPRPGPADIRRALTLFALLNLLLFIFVGLLF